MLRLVNSVRSPQRFENGSMREHPPWMLREERQQVEFLWRQADLTSPRNTRLRSRSIVRSPRINCPVGGTTALTRRKATRILASSSS